MMSCDKVMSLGTHDTEVGMFFYFWVWNELNEPSIADYVDYRKQMTGR